MKTVLVFGTFDVIHPGHEYFLRRARREGDRLVAVVARDEFVRRWKGREPVHDEGQRIAHLENSGLVDRALVSDTEIRTYRVVDTINPDIICLGHDQTALRHDLEAWLSTRDPSYPKVAITVLPPWKRWRYSSTRRNKALRGAPGLSSGTTARLPFFLLMVAAMTLWGLSWAIAKMATESAAPATLMFWRFLISFVSFLPVLFVTGKRAKESPREKIPAASRAPWLWGGLAALLLTLYNRLFFGGLTAGLAGKGGVIVTTLNPLFAFVLVVLTTRIRPGSRQLWGLLVGLAGGVLLLEPWHYGVGDFVDSGNLSFLSAALVWATLTLVSRKVQEKWEFGKFNLVLYTGAAVASLPFAAMAGPFLPEGAGASFWWYLLYLALLAGSLGTGLYFLAARRLGAARAGAFTFLVPASALVSSALILGEKPAAATVAGGVLAVLAVVMIHWSAISDPRGR